MHSWSKLVQCCVAFSEKTTGTVVCHGVFFDIYI